MGEVSGSAKGRGRGKGREGSQAITLTPMSHLSRRLARSCGDMGTRGCCCFLPLLPGDGSLSSSHTLPKDAPSSAT